MPLMTPEIQKALRAAGLEKKPSGNSPSEDGVNESFDAAGLTTQATLDTVCRIMLNGDTDAIQLKAAETVLKARGLLKEQVAPTPAVTIIIHDSNAPLNGVNPILFPRQKTPLGPS